MVMLKGPSSVFKFNRRITEPPEAMPFSSWYQGCFDSVYLALHPFFKIDGVNSDEAPRSVVYINRSEMADGNLLDTVKQISEQYNERFSIELSQLRRLEKKLGTPVSWEDIRIGCGFNSLGQIYTALLTTTMALKKEYQNVADAKHLQEFCSASNIFLPEESSFPTIMESRICSLLEDLACELVSISDEFNRTVVSIELLKLKTEVPWALSDQIDFRFNKLFPTDHSFLLIVPWDNFYTLICGNRRELEAANVSALFDGFWCDENTRSDWWLK